MAYKFQLGAARLSGSLVQEGTLEAETSFTIGNAVLTEAELEKLDGITDGTAAGNKAVVLDVNKRISGIDRLTGVGRLDATERVQVSGSSGGIVQLDIDSNDGRLRIANSDNEYVIKADIDPSKHGRIRLYQDGGSVVHLDASADSLSSSAGLEIVGNALFGGTLGVSGAVTIKGNVLMNENVTLGAGTDDRIKIPGLLSSSIALSHDNAFDLGTSAKQFKDLYVNGVGHIDAIRVADGGTIGCDSDTDLLTLADGVATVAGEISVTTLDIGGTNVTATAAELNFLDGLGDAAYDPSADSVVFFDVTDNKLKHEAANDFVDAINGTGLEADSGLLRLSAQGTGIAGGAGSTLSVAAAQTTIESIYNNSLKLGRSATDDNIDFGTDDSIIFNIDNGEKFRIASGSITAAVNSTFEGNVTVEGNLTVTGASIEVQQGFVVTSSVQFEGATPDGNEISLTSADPSTDRTITLPDLTGHVPLIAGAIGNANVTAAEFLLLDGGSTVGTTALASGDGFLHNDNGTMRQTSIDKIADFFAGDGLAASSGVLAVSVDDSSIETDSDTLRVKGLGITNAMLAGSIADSKLSTISTANKVSIAALDIDGADDINAALAGTDLIIVDDGANGANRKAAVSRIASYVGTNLAVNVELKDDTNTLAVGVNYFGTHSGNESVTLPASPSVGQSVKVKAGADCSSTSKLTINRAGSQTIDGELAIVLESPFAAVELIYVDDTSKLWRVF
mgnify:CR=1 FL=1|tara:strand:- start:1284 stop:3488 length:2205 start_codon:yes stop_codon:yes gene_type:complete